MICPALGSPSTTLPYTVTSYPPEPEPQSSANGAQTTGNWTSRFFGTLMDHPSTLMEPPVL